MRYVNLRLLTYLLALQSAVIMKRHKLTQNVMWYVKYKINKLNIKYMK